MAEPQRAAWAEPEQDSHVSSPVYRSPIQDQYSQVIRPVGYRAEDGDWIGSGWTQAQRAVSNQQPIGPDALNDHQADWYTASPVMHEAASMPDPSLTAKIRDVLSAEDARDPYGQLGEDPSLLKLRSQTLYDRENAFWDSMEEEAKAQPRKAEKKQQESAKPDKINRTAKHRAQLLREGGRAAVVILLSVVAAFILLDYGYFRVRDIVVEGNTDISAEDIVAMSGLSLGDRMLHLDTEKAETQLSQNRYLVLEGIQTTLPDKVTITVRERTPAAVMNYGGINYTIDNRGMVLEESYNVDETDGLILISGMNISGQNGCAVGRQIRTTSSAQLAVMQQILVELKVLSASEEVSRLMMSDLSNLLLETRDGYSVRMGDSTAIHAKLKAMLYVRMALIAMESGTGTIDVSNPTEPTFIPEV